MSFDISNEDGDPTFVFLCDHASNALPAEYGTLGVGEEEFERHIAWDIGAAGVVHGLASRFGAPAITAHYSRLLIDLNRGVDDPTLIMKLSDGAIVPGNHYVDEAEIQARIEKYYRPYHDAITSVVDRALQAGQVPVLISVHSFTKSWKEQHRPWHVGLLWDRDDRAVEPLMAHFSRDPSLIVGNNQPYTGELAGDTLYTHGTLRGLPHALVELRQDLVATPEGIEDWVDRIEAGLRDLLKTPEIWTEHHFGSHSDE